MAEGSKGNFAEDREAAGDLNDREQYLDLARELTGPAIHVSC